MRLPPDTFETVMQLSRALRDWSRKKVDASIKGPERTYEGNLSKAIAEPLQQGRQFCDVVLDCLCDLDPKVANNVEIELKELLRRAVEVDRRNKPPDFVQKYATDIAKELEDIAEGRITQIEGSDDGAYIPFSKPIEFSGGILNRKNLEKAIKQGKPVKVRSRKPSKYRCEVHIQDVLVLMDKLATTEKAAEVAAQMFGEWKNQLQKRTGEQMNLD